MALTDQKFDLLFKNQFCDNSACTHYNLVDQGNLKINSRKKGQLYCRTCQTVFSVRKGTMFFGLRTPIDKIIKVLTLLCSGMGTNAICRTEGVTADSIRSWLSLSARQMDEFSAYMQHNMHLTQVQIDEFWSFVLKKKSILDKSQKT